ncbi:MAG: hypothetical protein NTY48_05900 [Candidatus Diapherotrites archaeon]|nr:hypothetical protein [Candidatus Diapherotrites archaeon]
MMTIKPRHNKSIQAQITNTQTDTSVQPTVSGPLKKLSLIIILLILIISVPAGIYSATGGLLTLAKISQTIFEITHILTTVIIGLIIFLIAAFGKNGTLGTLYKIILIIVFASIPFGLYYIIRKITVELTQNSREISATLAIILFVLIILSFKKVTD